MAKGHYLLAFARCNHHCSLCGRLFAYGYANMNPHLLWRQTHPPPISGLRQEARESVLHGVTEHPVYPVKLYSNPHPTGLASLLRYGGGSSLAEIMYVHDKK